MHSHVPVLVLGQYGRVANDNQKGLGSGHGHVEALKKSDAIYTLHILQTMKVKENKFYLLHFDVKHYR